MGGFLSALGVGAYLARVGPAYGPIFVVCGSAHLIALGGVHLRAPRREPVRLKAL